ncbi:type IX secretion system sortase PorU [Hymenobacter latericus]|uniref:type IX secretion system sortase PorU n=1 Tax=Hymenobacter sp. YIM 151858-1 TaxID=2987688 RepID=UPI00222741B0|nr:type IX secretion system sortase PorU [Hymenobacter sp. YIM 151858-1]UYZ57744.1 type IX secretion system sortase PorU [Hymenobacter sp. YIM 151858-1]
MRFFTSLLILAIVGWSWAAQAQAPAQQVQLTWRGQAVAFPQGGQGIRVPTFTTAVFETGQRVPSVHLRLNGYVAEVQLQATQYAPFTAPEAAAFAGASVGAAPQVQLRYGTENRQPVTLASLVPLRRNPQTGQLEKLVSFEYTYRTGSSPVQARTNRTYAPNSVLRQGEWFKIGVTNTSLGNGNVFKLDKAFLRNLGLPVQSLDPRRLQLYGHSLGMLPQANSAPRPDDLEENAIYFADNGGNNAAFDDDEYFLFYSPGPHTWELNGGRFRHRLNLYTDTAYYFLTVGSTLGKRVAPAPAVTGIATAEIREYTDHFFYERDLLNLLKSGRQWLGETFSGNAGLQKEFTFAGITDLVVGSPLLVTSSAAATALPPGGTTSFSLALNGTALGTQLIRNQSCNPGTAFCYEEAANTELSTHTANAPAGPDLRIRLTYAGTPSDLSATGYLDYLEVQARRQLRLGNTPLLFRSLENVSGSALSAFVLQNAGNALVWDVTEPRTPQAVAQTAGRFLARSNQVREYVAFAPNASFDTPRAFGRVANQNLHAIGAGAPVDLAIVTHPLFVAEAERLAAHRRTHDGLRTAVVTTNQIYNEFSSGGQDITAIRDFVKMLYDRRGGAPGLYVLLLGDASYDYKADPGNAANQLPAWWKDRQVKDADNQNLVPTYEAIESFAKVAPRFNGQGVSYCSDDYYAYLDDNEGAWPEDGSAGAQVMDAAVGRLPVRFGSRQANPAAMAAEVVRKLIEYDLAPAQGKWRNRLTFVADDGDNNQHLDNSEDTANPLVSTQPGFQVNKVYLDMYPQVSTASGQRSPNATAALDAAIEQGSLLVSYAGHGGPTAWADEKLITDASVQQLQNRQRLTFMFTGTCDFAQYDDPGFTSAGEQLLTDTPNGAIGLLTTTRLVYASNNQALANAFYRHLFQRNAATGRWPRLGDAVVFGKNNDFEDVYNRNFSLLGDPSMRLAMPDLVARTARLSDANDPTRTPLDTVRALQRVRLEGEVVNPVGNALQSDFNGKVQVTVYEKADSVRTLGNENLPKVVVVQRNVMYDGQATVRNGRFFVQFVVPKDINYRFGLGKISLYAADSTRNVDAHGANPRIVVGGAAKAGLTDTIPPTIRLAMDTESFAFGGLTRPNTTLLATLTDSSGINTAGTGIGHELTATLDNDPAKVTVLNEYYTADLNKFTSGRVRYLFKNLTPGPHVLRVKAWDNFNNSGEREIEFIVARDEKLALSHIINYPNPFATHTAFHFDHNRPGEDLDVQVQIFTVSGKLVRTLSAYVPASESHVKTITWNGRDEYNDQLARGVYVYRLSVRTSRDAPVSKYEKLVLLN